MSIAIEFNNISKLYRLGLVSTGTLAHDLKRWWTINVRREEDPYLKIGETNDRSTKGESDYVWALKDIDFKVEQGDVVGIIGKNGAGKSTLLKLLSKVTAPTTGEIRAKGRIGSLLEVGTGFHPEMTGRENIYMNGAILGMTKPEITRKLDEIIDFSGCERYIDTPVKRYSSGMMVRLGFAVAAHLDPEILVVDEVLAVGDAEFQKKAIGKMQDVSRGEGRTVLFVSHNMTAVKQLCKSGIVLANGKISYSGTAEKAIEKYLGINAEATKTPLSIRTDRIGDGKIKVVDITLHNKNNQIVTEAFVGQYLKIEFKVEVNADIDPSKLIVGCLLYDPYGTLVMQWASDEMVHDFSNVTSGSFFLEIPALNMRPNAYSMYVQLSLGTTAPEDFCDAIHSAFILNVMNDSFFLEGVNIRPNRGYTALLQGKYFTDP
ncbi:MAG: ABC transporter ATP-binding protein [Bacteroidales bacterium]|nr:ABC transporter ATP-binding protein [Bacteroidales bacterium]